MPHSSVRQGGGNGSSGGSRAWRQAGRSGSGQGGWRVGGVPSGGPGDGKKEAYRKAVGWEWLLETGLDAGRRGCSCWATQLSAPVGSHPVSACLLLLLIEPLLISAASVHRG